MSRCAYCLSVGLCLAVFLLPSGAGPLGSVYHVERMTTVQISSLDRVHMVAMGKALVISGERRRLRSFAMAAD